MNKRNNYFKALFASATFYAGLTLGVLLTLAYAVCNTYGFIDKFISNSSLLVNTVLIIFGISVLFFAIAGFTKINKKTLSFSDAFIGFLLAFISGAIYSIIKVEGNTLAKIIALSVEVLLVVAFSIARAKFFDHKYDALPSNVTFKSYYKAFFKTYGAISVIFAVVLGGAMVLIEKANVVGAILNANSLKIVAVVGGAGLLVLYSILYANRLSKKELGVIDVSLFALLGGIVGLIPVAFMVGEAFKTLALIVLAVAVVVVITLTAIVIKNTHVYTDDENKSFEKAKNGFCAYFKALAKSTNLFAVIGVSAVILSLVFFAIGIKFIHAFSVATGITKFSTILIAVGVIVVMFALLVIADVKSVRITCIDVALAVWNLVFVGILIIRFAVSKASLDGWTIVAIVCIAVGLALFIARTRFVRYGAQAEKIAEETTPITQAVVTENQPDKEVESEVVAVKPIEEIAVAETVEVEEISAVEDIVIAEVSEEQIAVEEVDATSEIAVAEETLQVENDTTEEVEEVKVQPNVKKVSTSKRKRVVAKKTYENYIRTGDAQLKENYSAIKNAFYAYGVHSRITKTRENFSKKGVSISKENDGKALHLQAKLQVRGKFVKLYLNVDPTTIDAKYFRHEDVSNKSPDQPTLVKIRSKLTLKRSLELIDTLAEKQGFTKKKKYESVNYAELYSDKDLTYMEKLGFDYMVKDSVTLQEVMAYDDEFAKKVIKSEIIAKPERYIYDVVTLDALADNFAEGEVVDMEGMRAKGLVKINANSIKVVPSEKLSKKLIVIATEFDPKAVEMIAIAGGECTQLVEG